MFRPTTAPAIVVAGHGHGRLVLFLTPAAADEDRLYRSVRRELVRTVLALDVDIEIEANNPRRVYVVDALLIPPDNDAQIRRERDEQLDQIAKRDHWF